MFINDMTDSDQWWHEVSTEMSSWNSAVNSRQVWEKWSQVMDHLLSGSEQLSSEFIYLDECSF